MHPVRPRLFRSVRVPAIIGSVRRISITLIGTGLAAITACTSGSGGPATSPTLVRRPVASPGEVIAVAGNGREGTNRGRALVAGISRPLALDATKNGDLLFLSASQGSAINAVNADGTTLPYPSKSAQQNMINIIGSPHSSLLLPNDDYLMLDWVGGLSVVRRDGTAQYLGTLTRQMGTEDGQLARGRQGAPLIVAAGHLYTLSLKGKPRLKRVELPAQVEGKVEVAAAGQSRGTLLIATRAAVVAVHDKSVVQTWKIRSESEPEDSIPTSLAPDGSGGIWIGISAARSGHIMHLRRDGAVRAVLIGDVDCTASPPPQPQQQTRIPREFPLRRPSALLIHNNQLYVADRDCSRIIAVGLPVE